MHTVLLLGELDRASAPALEAEIERLCALGVDALTLDLNGLTEIDTIGVAVIVYRRGWCERRGCELELLADTPLVREAFARAGGGERVPFVRERIDTRVTTRAQVALAAN
ncbi:MAG TPA: STAS domain-containing protein [Solirubrobacteraceae bacterium]|jgi:anti-anti-sigma factor|nr:STAS domain-containing protein [Solirubrobacteraceae bacterium]